MNKKIYVKKSGIFSRSVEVDLSIKVCTHMVRIGEELAVGVVWRATFGGWIEGFYLIIYGALNPFYSPT